MTSKQSRDCPNCGAGGYSAQTLTLQGDPGDLRVVVCAACGVLYRE